MNFNPSKPYNDLPKLPPDIDIETKAILKQVNLSNKALAGLKEYSEIVPNKDILINAVVLKEAKDSSEIENIITTHDELYKALISNIKNIDSNTKEVLNYRKALWIGYNLVKESELLITNTIIFIQQELEQNNAGIRKLPGTFLKNDRTKEIIYTPPGGEEVIRKFLKNLEDYINIDKNDIDPLIKMTVIHYQFESIHPFYDGNGRTGRIINVLYLVLKKLLDTPILYMSNYIIKNKTDYYRLLQGVRTKNNWEAWVLFMLKAVEETSKNTLLTLKSIKILMDNSINKVKKLLPHINNVGELVEVIFYQPYTKINFLEKKLSVTRQTASQYLKKMEEIGILQSVKLGREMLYLNVELYKLLKN